MSHADDDSLSESRAERIKQMVGNLLPRIRPLSGHLSEDELLEAATYMAIYRVADEEDAAKPAASPAPSPEAQAAAGEEDEGE